MKGGLAAAYAAGERPVFHMVLPGGMDELWRLADVALVMPVVPAGAPPELEYALRLRRDTIIAGTCPSCGAAVDVEALEVDALVPFGTAVFEHRRSCPANDRDAKRLLRAFLSRASARSIEERLDAANRETRTRIEPWTRRARIRCRPGRAPSPRRSGDAGSAWLTTRRISSSTAAAWVWWRSTPATCVVGMRRAHSIPWCCGSTTA